MKILALLALSLTVGFGQSCTQIPGCKTCRNPDPTCDTCNPGTIFTYDDQGTPMCADCEEGCLTCDLEKVCSKCMSGYLMGTLGCVACTGNCYTCELMDEGTNTECKKCNDRYYKDNGLCKACSNSKCTKCSSKGTCSTCDDGYKKNTGEGATNSQLCVPCPASCTQCVDVQTGSVAACTACKDGYYLTEAATCTACSNVDTNCALCSSQQTCDVSGCNDYYYNTEDSSNCKACVPPDLCTECAPSDTGALACRTCKDVWGAKTEDQLTCDPCYAANCAQCPDDPDTCTGCLTNFYMYNSECVAAGTTGCVTNCGWCVGPEADDCTACGVGYGLVDDGTNDDSIQDNGIGTCSACDSDCTDCVTPAQDGCISCSGSLVRAGLGATFACKNSLATCQVLDPDDPTQCIQCVASSAGGDCGGDCHSSCHECKGTPVTECYSCPPAGADLDGLGSCLDCNDGHCKICNDVIEGACIECDAGYGLNNVATCKQCSAGCAECSPDSSNPGEVKCDTCQTGYQIKSGACIICPKDCASCTEIDGLMVCNAGGCKPGYRRNTEQCAPCSANCKNCVYDPSTGSMVCTECMTRYTLDAEKTCDACPSYCTLCTFSEESGVTCESGKCENSRALAANKKSCQACSSLTEVNNCVKCTDTNSKGESTCKECKEGYFLNENSTECLEEFVSCALSVDESLRCYECQTGYNKTLDGLCFIDCFTCGTLESGKSEKQCNLEENEYSMDQCFGVCWTVRNNTDGTIKVARGCSADTCPTNILNNELCETAVNEKTQRCRSCCVTGECNVLILDGHNGIGKAAPTTRLHPTLLILALLPALLLH